MPKEILIAGAGWLGGALALTLKADGHVVSVLSRNSEKRSYFMAHHIPLIEVDYAHLEYTSLHDESNKILFIGIPPVPDYCVIINSLILTLAPSHIIFSSATSVYGTTHGEVSENSDLGGNNTLEEAELLITNSGIPFNILRFGGLIGEDRNPASYFSGKLNIPNGGAPVNLIHRTEIIEIICALINEGKTGIFNVVHPFHPTRKAYYEKQCLVRGLLPCEFNSDGIGKLINGSKISDILNRPYRYDIE
jgi:nucleoside-diphosphate-sugar epimerase